MKDAERVETEGRNGVAEMVKESPESLHWSVSRGGWSQRFWDSEEQGHVSEQHCW